MKRFGCKQARLPFPSLLLSIAIFAVVVLSLLFGIDTLARRTQVEQRQSLERALHRGVVECYATEGAYPRSLDYLKEHYSISYNQSVFFVDYQPVGENILPEITVILRGGKP